MFTKIRVISIPVINEQVAKEFYTDALRARVETDIPFGTDDKTRWISLQLPGVETRITLVIWFPQLPPGSAQGIARYERYFRGALRTEAARPDDLRYQEATLRPRGDVQRPRWQRLGASTAIDIGITGL